MKAATYFLILVLVWLVAGCAGPHSAITGEQNCRGMFRPHYEDSYFAVSQGCNVSAEVLPGSEGFRTGANDFLIILHDRRDRDIEGAGIRFVLLDSAGQEESVAGDVRDEGHGLYSVRNLKLPRIENRVLVLVVAANRISDRILLDPGAMKRTTAEDTGHDHDAASGVHVHQGHEHQKMPRMQQIPDSLNTSRQVLSEKAYYLVSYHPPGGAIPLNDFHSWELKVHDTRGNPVQAVVTVNGDMPGHGHGLPTRPKAEPAGPGLYRVDGLKFHMPGWWYVEFTILTAARNDRAVFNFILKH